jgi:hypothetical protein
MIAKQFLDHRNGLGSTVGGFDVVFFLDYN